MELTLAVASEFQRLADEVGIKPTKMQIQKLVYYANAWSMVLRNTDLVEEPFTAMRFGPGIRTLRRHHNRMAEGKELPFLGLEFPYMLTDDDRAFIKAVWESYKTKSAYQLSQMTHQETPWLEGRVGVEPDSSKGNEINPDSIYEFQKTQDVPEPLIAYRAEFERQEREAEEYLRQRSAKIAGAPT